MFDENVNPLPTRLRMPSNSTLMGSGTTPRSVSDQQSRRSSSTTLKKENLKKDFSTLTARLALEEQDNRQLRDLLEIRRKELAVANARADRAEDDLVQVTSRFMAANQERLNALREITHLKGQLELYKAWLNAAKAEIHRGQAFINQINKSREEAEKSAASYKSAKRKLSQDLLAREWKDEGIKQGFLQGMERARAEVEAFEALREENSEPPVIPPRYERDSGVTEDDTYTFQDDETQTSRRQSYHTDFTTITRPETPTNVDTAPPPPPPSHIPYPPPDPHNEEPYPIPIPPPGTHHLDSGDIRPVAIHNIPSSPRHPPVHIPLDGFIPVADTASNITLPPQHELAPPPPITSPSPSFVPLGDTKFVPPPGMMYTPNMTTGYRPAHASSPESNSTTFSEFEMINNAPARYSPQMSVIHEASERNSPIPSANGGHDLHRNTSLRSSKSSRHSPAPQSQAGPRPPSRQDDHRSHHSQSPVAQRSLNRRPSIAASTSSRHGKASDIYGIYTRPTSSHGSSGGRNTPAMGGAPGAGYAPNPYEDRFGTRTPKARAQDLPEAARRPTPLDDTSFLTKTPKARPEDLPDDTDEDDFNRHREPPHVVIPRQPDSGTSPTMHRSSPGIYTGPYLNPHRPSSVQPSPSWHSENSANIGVDVESPTPPRKDAQQFEENPREFREFLGPSDAERAPLPMMMSPSQSNHTQLYSQPSNTLHSVPAPGTPIFTPGGGIFIPTGPPSPSPGVGGGSNLRPSSPRPPSPSGPRNMPGGYMDPLAGGLDESQPPVIPDPTILRKAQESDTESDGVLSSAVQSAFTTSPITSNVARQLPPSAPAASTRGKGRGGAAATAGRGGKKKKR
ncbi:hypothetical protein K435DRAFT_451385 [Dendrothele bispora CBS 962.96]|uniref:Uncharacterized protein n=1 Tax=Dendrothele bispora (strain CBS 962.96) TaxID=1314807 RepID=A0A4S8MTZ2_DENBC|nr:hypothetical protein K435DRAFT_451385 [Dendrothele bispora CBS 962.96]